MAKRAASKAKHVDLPFAPPQWPASRVEMWPLEKIKPYPKNPRTHPEVEVDALAADMKTDGVTTAILVDEAGVIIFGHARRLAALKNKFKEYPVSIAIGWSEDQKKAVRIKDNHRPLMAAWDYDMLRLEIGELKLAGADLAQFQYPEFSGFLAANGEGLSDPSGEWAGMPGFSNPDAKGFRAIVVHFHDQAGVDAFSKAILQKITDKTKFVWYPEIKIKPFLKYK